MQLDRSRKLNQESYCRKVSYKKYAIRMAVTGRIIEIYACFNFSFAFVTVGSVVGIELLVQGSRLVHFLDVYMYI